MHVKLIDRNRTVINNKLAFNKQGQMGNQTFNKPHYYLRMYVCRYGDHTLRPIFKKKIILLQFNTIKAKK